MKFIKHQKDTKKIRDDKFDILGILNNSCTNLIPLQFFPGFDFAGKFLTAPNFKRCSGSLIAGFGKGISHENDAKI
jgi:hypothetical protein